MRFLQPIIAPSALERHTRKANASECSAEAGGKDGMLLCSDVEDCSLIIADKGGVDEDSA